VGCHGDTINLTNNNQAGATLGKEKETHFDGKLLTHYVSV
jgi:hypothetical protein